MENPTSVSRGQTHLDQCCPKLTNNLCNVLIPFTNQGDEETSKISGGDFLWHGSKEGRKYNLFNWQTTQLSREQGGLGIRNLRRQNTSLLMMKWLCRNKVKIKPQGKKSSSASMGRQALGAQTW